MTEVWIASLVGKDVFHEHSVECVFSNINDLSKLRECIAAKHGIKFSDDPDIHFIRYRKYRNISDNRDISLIIELVPSL